MRKKEIFKSPFVGIDEKGKYAIIYDVNGNYSVYIKMDNPCIQYNGDADSYYRYQSLFANIIKILGPGYAIQKHDVLSKKKWKSFITNNDWLMNKHFEHFEGRVYKESQTVLILTGELNRSRFFAYDENKFTMFIDNVEKVINVLQDHDIPAHVMNKQEMKNYLHRYFAQDFEDDACSLDNFGTRRNELTIGNKNVRCISLVDVELVEMPNWVTPYKNEFIADRKFPRDMMAFLSSIPSDTVVYNQVIHIVSQGQEKAKLEAKKRKHTSMPDPANNLCVEDITRSMEDIERNGQVLVYTHFDIIISSREDLSRALNMVETSMLDMNINISKQAYNQYELFRCAMPGNSYELKDYDLFLTSADVAVCLMCKEALPKNEDSDFIVWLNDRQGVPLAIDPSDLAMFTGRCQNRNKFVLGPSGSGKSFFMNCMLFQYAMSECDIVIVDTGHSYFYLNKYLKGKYITYSEEKPITMNPFKITKEEFNVEKINFIKNLIILLWKEGKAAEPEEATLIEMVVRGYYNNYFYGNTFSEDEKNRIRENQLQSWYEEEYHDDDEKTLEAKKNKIEKYIEEEERIFNQNNNTELKVTSLSFNSFYEFAQVRMKELIEVWDISFNLKSFLLQLHLFYRGGTYDRMLNEESDSTLFQERFIVFEIDSIKENAKLFPIVTLVIMDVFIQKMRLKANRKALIIEEAWKAIASPTMAQYILYLYKTVRKFRGEAMIVTQELDDIIKNEVVKSSVIANSDTVILLDQTKFRNNYKEVAEVLALSEVEQNKIFTVNNIDNKSKRGKFKEVYIKRGNVGEVYGNEVSQHEYFTFTTERPEKEAVSVYVSVYKNFSTAIDKLVDDLNVSGISLIAFLSIINSSYLSQHIDKGIEHFEYSKNAIIKEFKDSGKSLHEFFEELKRKTA